jgi:hypothetical protein
VTDGNTYQVYTAPSRSQALDFLRAKEVRHEREYLIVETSEGSFGKDLVMIFDEKTGEMIEYGEKKPLPQFKKSMERCAKCGCTVLPAGRAVAGATEFILIEDMKKDGVGYVCSKCRTLWCPFCASLQGHNAICGICKNSMELFRS